MVGRVAGSSEDTQRKGSSDRDDVPVAHRPTREVHRFLRRHQIGHAQLLGKRPTSRDIVVVDVRLGYTRDPHPFGPRQAEHSLDVTLGVDDGGHASIVEEVGTVTQLRSGERNGLDHGGLLSFWLKPGPRTCTPAGYRGNAP
jgi:hypothetical protein